MPSPRPRIFRTSGCSPTALDATCTRSAGRWKKSKSRRPAPCEEGRSGASSSSSSTALPRPAQRPQGGDPRPSSTSASSPCSTVGRVRPLWFRHRHAPARARTARFQRHLGDVPALARKLLAAWQRGCAKRTPAPSIRKSEPGTAQSNDIVGAHGARHRTRIRQKSPRRHPHDASRRRARPAVEHFLPAR